MTTEIITIAAPVDVEELIRGLVCDPGQFPEAAMRACQQHRELVTPALIRELEHATERIRAGEAPVGDAAWLGFYLLWEFRAKEALPAILALISLPDEGPFTLLGDGITEDLPYALTSLAGDNLKVIAGLVSNQELNPYVRGAAAQCYSRLVRDGAMTRADAVEHLRQHLRVALDHSETEITTSLVIELCNLNPQEALAEIREAFDRDLVEEFVVDRAFCERQIARGDKEFLTEQSLLRPTHLADTVEHLRGWYCFQPRKEFKRENRSFVSSLLSPSDFLPPDRNDSFLPDDDEMEQQSYSHSSTIRNDSPRIGRNNPCPCGSGKKYKKCCMRSEPLL